MDHTDFAASVRAFVDRFNAGDPEAVQHYIAREFYAYVPGPGEPTATETWNELTSDLWEGLPDLHIEVDELEPDPVGEHLAGRITIRGTHTGPLWGAPPSGASIEWQTAVSVRPVNGTFAVNFEGVTPPALMGVLRQLELVNPPDQMDLPPKHPNSSVPDFLLRVAFNGQVADRPCGHLETATVFDTDITVCAECVAAGDVWPSLRLCVSCGYVGCCDTSKNTHMKRHAEETGHVLMRSIRLDEGWMWCYADNAFFGGRTMERLRAQAGD